MTSPYIYRISNGPKWYIGSRTAKNCYPGELGVKYFTSSKEIQKDFKENPQNWIKEIIYTADECADDNVEELEGLLLEMVNAQDDPLSYNKHNNRFMNNNWNCSKAGQFGIQKMTTEARRRGGLKNGISGHNKQIASSGGQAYSKKLQEDSKFKELVTARSRQAATVKKQCDHCSIITNRDNITRWHNDNCKDKK